MHFNEIKSVEIKEEQDFFIDVHGIDKYKLLQLPKLLSGDNINVDFLSSEIKYKVEDFGKVSIESLEGFCGLGSLALLKYVFLPALKGSEGDLTLDITFVGGEVKRLTVRDGDYSFD